MLDKVDDTVYRQKRSPVVIPMPGKKGYIYIYVCVCESVFVCACMCVNHEPQNNLIDCNNAVNGRTTVEFQSRIKTIRVP
jgi:hypothetical protein